MVESKAIGSPEQRPVCAVPAALVSPSEQPYSASREERRVIGHAGYMERPPLLVRMAFRMRFPVPRPWRVWAYDEIRRIYGDHPSEEDTPFTWGSAAWGVMSTRRRSPARRKLMRLHAVGLRSDGSPMPPEGPWQDPTGWSDRSLLLLPLLFPLCVIGASALIALVVFRFG